MHSDCQEAGGGRPVLDCQGDRQLHASLDAAGARGPPLAWSFRSPSLELEKGFGSEEQGTIEMADRE